MIGGAAALAGAAGTGASVGPGLPSAFLRRRERPSAAPDETSLDPRAVAAREKRARRQQRNLDLLKSGEK